MQRRTMNNSSGPGPGRAPASAATAREVLFEFTAIGNSVKVSAVDTETLVEATIIGPVSAGEQALKQAAFQKLRYVLTKKRSEAKAQTNRQFA
jgi:hypothetical protein